MRITKTIAALGGVTTLAVVLAGCGEGAVQETNEDIGTGNLDTVEGNADETAGTLEGETITVGSKDFDEQLVLGHITRLALEHAGADVVDEINLGGTDPARQALVSGNIDTYWEYNGTAWISFFEETDPIQDEQEQYEVVRDRDLEENQLVWMEPAPFNNTYGIAYQADNAETLGNPETISDLGPLIEDNPENATLCVENEFSTRNDGLPGMEEAYGFEFPDDAVNPVDTALVYQGINEGNPCLLGEIFTTDGRVTALDLTVLEDDQGFFPLYNPSPVFREEVYEPNAEELDAIFNPIAEALTQETMTALNEEVSVNTVEPDQVAEDWLTENNFIG